MNFPVIVPAGSQHFTTVTPPPSDRSHNGNNGNGFSRICHGSLWTIAMMMLAWYLLPLMIEQYQYAATKGKDPGRI